MLRLICRATGPGLAGLLVLTGCVAPGAGSPTAVGLTGGEVPVAAQAAALQAMFGENASAIGQGAAAFCVAVGEGPDRTDASAALLSELRGGPKVKPASACRTQADTGAVFDRSSGRPALLFHVQPDRCDTASDCLVTAGYYEGNLSAQQNQYRVRRNGDLWVAIVEERGPIS